jgi:hypothetical protein
VTAQIQFKRGPASTTSNPILAVGEPWVELDGSGVPTGKLKLGDGVTHVNSLPYFAGNGAFAPLASPALTGTPTVNGATIEDRTHAAATYTGVAALTAEGTSRSNADAAHIAANDPHGDRANFSTIKPLLSPRVITGWFRPALATASRSLTGTLNRLYLAPCYSGDGLTIDQLDLWTVTGTATSTVLAGVYVSSSSSAPFTTGTVWNLAGAVGPALDCSATATRSTSTLATAAVVPADTMFAVAGVMQTAAASIQTAGVTGSTSPTWTPLGWSTGSSASAMLAQPFVSFYTDLTAGASLPSTVTFDSAKRLTVDSGIGYRRSA